MVNKTMATKRSGHISCNKGGVTWRREREHSRNDTEIVTVRDVIIKEFEVDSIPDNTETPDLLDEGSQQLGTWHPDDGQQDHGNKEERAHLVQKRRSYMTQRAWALKKRHWDKMPQILKKQHWMKYLLQQEGISGTRTLWKTVKGRTSHRQLASLKRHWSKRTGQSSDKGNEQGMFRNFLEKSGLILLWLRVTMWNPKQSMKPGKGTIGISGTGQWRTRSRHSKTTRLRTYWDHAQTGASYRANGSTKWKWNLVVKWSNKKHAMWRKTSNRWKNWTAETFAPTCKPETFRILLQLSA